MYEGDEAGVLVGDFGGVLGVRPKVVKAVRCGRG